MRARWAAIGAACAVTLGGGTLGVVRAVQTSGERSTYVPVTPARILDTRSDVGATDILDATPVLLTVTGTVRTTRGTSTVVPSGASGVVVNVTAVNPSVDGFVSLRPGNASGEPDVSTLNVTAGGIFPNGATITLPTSGGSAGQVQIWFEGNGRGGRTDLLIDVVGYYTDHNHDDRYYTKSEIDTSLGATADAITSAKDAAFWENHDLATLIATPPHTLSLSDVKPSRYEVGLTYGIATKADGNPVITYVDDEGTDALHMISCAEPTCTVSVSEFTIDDPVTALGPWTSVAVGSDGKPVVAYTDEVLSTLKIAICTNIFCASSVISDMDPGGHVSGSAPMVIPPGAYPLVAYLDTSTNDLKIAACHDATCVAASVSRRVITTSHNVNHFIRAALDFDGNPVIAYTTTSGEIYLVKCNDAACTTNANPVLIDTVGYNSHLAMATGPTGNPVLVYANSGGFVVTQCDSASCGTRHTSYYSAVNPSHFDVSVGPTALPIITFFLNKDLLVMRCSNIWCLDNQVGVADSIGVDRFSARITFLGNGMPVAVYRHDGANLRGGLRYAPIAVNLQPAEAGAVLQGR